MAKAKVVAKRATVKKKAAVKKPVRKIAAPVNESSNFVSWPVAAVEPIKDIFAAEAATVPEGPFFLKNQTSTVNALYKIGRALDVLREAEARLTGNEEDIKPVLRTGGTQLRPNDIVDNAFNLEAIAYSLALAAEDIARNYISRF